MNHEHLRPLFDAVWERACSCCRECGQPIHGDDCHHCPELYYARC